MLLSVLFLEPKDRLPDEQATEPDFFVDLNLDQIVAAVTKGKEEYNLTPFFYMPLHDADAVLYRQETMHDLDNEPVKKVVTDFAEHMRRVRELLAHTEEKLYHARQRERWFLDAAETYEDAVAQLTHDLPPKQIHSRGFKGLKKYLDTLVESKQFKHLVEQTKQIRKELDAISYEVLIEGLRVEVRKYKNEPDYGTEIQHLFRRFSQESDHHYVYGFRDGTEMNHVEEKILDLVADLFSDTFAKLTAFRSEHTHFQDATVVRFDREIQFYIAYQAYIEKLETKKLRFCYPATSSISKVVDARESFDLALAAKLTERRDAPVTNDFALKGKERIIVVSGPNQGGKTTFARMFGQLHYLASLGLPVPGSSAHLYLPDRIYTHFEREEKMANLRGKLEDDLERMHVIFETATPHSLVLINEIFTSTTLYDAISLSKKIADTIMDLDILCVWISFIDELSTLSDKTISMVSTVVPNRPAKRTFKISRRPADGLAYAISIAEKHHLTYNRIKQRIER